MNDTSKHPRHKWSRGWSLGLVAGAITLVPARADALLPAAAAAIVGFYQEAYSYLSIAKPLFEDSGPDLAQALRDVETHVINEVKSVRNQAWRAQAQTVFDNFQILGIRKASHRDNPRLWAVSWDLSRQTINDFVEIVNARDTSSAYEMAAAFNALIAVNGELTQMMGEIYPGDPPTWGEYDLYFKHGIRADYAMIGMRKGLCWPGFDPGAGNYGTVANGHYVKNTYRYSMFYEDKIANKNVPLAWLDEIIQGRGGSNELTVPGNCNPGKHTCDRVPLTRGDPFPTAGSLAQAEAIIKPTFDNDPVVVAVRGGMSGIMSLGGGDDNFDNSNTDLPATGARTEPWIYEPACNQAVYPYRP